MQSPVVCDVLISNTIHSTKLCPTDQRDIRPASSYRDYQTAIDTSISPCQAFQSVDQGITIAM
jgi:hypothetical protein